MYRHTSRYTRFEVGLKSIFCSNSKRDLRDSRARMSELELTEKLLAEMGGWEAMKTARALLANGRVLSGNWAPPVLKGVIQAESGSLRSGLVIKSRVDVENLCPCRQSREWGTICAHSLAVGLRVLQRDAIKETTQTSEKAPVPQTPSRPPGKSSELRRTVVADGNAPELQLWVVFPPNWLQALGGGKVTLFFEGETQAGRRPLNAIPTGPSYTMEARDVALIEALEALTGGMLPAMWPFEDGQFGEMLPSFEGHPRLTLGKKNQFQVSAKAWTPKLRVHLEEKSGEIELELAEAVSDLTFVPARKLYVARPNGIQPMGLPASCAPVLQGAIRIARPEVPGFLQSCGAFLGEAEHCEANFAVSDFEWSPEPPQFSLSLSGGLGILRARMSCEYGERVIPLGEKNTDEAVWLPDPASPLRFATRDVPAEKAALNRVLRHGFRGPDASGWYELRGEDAVLEFFAREYPKLRQEWSVDLDERLERSTANRIERVEPRFQVRSSGVQWLDFKVDYVSEAGSQFSEAEIQQWLLSGRSHRKLSNGKVAMLDTGAVEEFREVLRDCSPEQQRGGYRMESSQAGFLEASVRDLGWQMDGGADWQARCQSLNDTVLEVPELGSLDGTLRGYQKQGVAWLDFLRRNEFGGILADEMGLGKTLQILALLRAAHQRCSGKQKIGAPFQALVVCPTSLVYNWVAEAKRFVPELRVLALQGAQRKRAFGQLDQADVVITSYALIRRDLSRYESRSFDYVVLDEAQHIKNRETQNAKAVKAIPAKHRLVLTGTPMENSVLDLWSIFDFLMPGYLGSAADFAERYEGPITRDRSPEVMERLGRRLRPFVLRRTKREVAPELPEKLDQTVTCPLNDEQRAVYRQVMDNARRDVLAATEKSGKGRLQILNALTRLRQICCDLRLLNLPDVQPQASGKLAMFQELLEQVLDGGHRVLVFSQFVSMLKLLRESLDEQSIEYCYLDGGTQDRGAVVQRFQSTEIPVFLISLKAGGVGLNLTGADTVIHFDPWWNPAIEDQATGRAHRIGQTRMVTSYKLIAEETVEEKIVQLQERKREVIAGTLGDENQFAESLTMEDFQALFAD